MTLRRGMGTATFLALDLFDPAPPQTLGQAYLARMETDHEQ